VVIAVAHHQPPPVLVNLIGELLDIGGHLSAQRRRQHLPGTITNDLVEQRLGPTHPPQARIRCKTGALFVKAGGRSFSRTRLALPYGLRVDYQWETMTAAELAAARRAGSPS
jgi:hypothetical protein